MIRCELKYENSPEGRREVLEAIEHLRPILGKISLADETEENNKKYLHAHLKLYPTKRYNAKPK